MLRRYSFEATPDEGGSFVVLGDALEYAGREAHKERERIIALIEDMMRTSCIIRDGDTGVWLVLSDLLRDIRNQK